MSEQTNWQVAALRMTVFAPADVHYESGGWWENDELGTVNELRRIFELAVGESFEDGMETEFSRQLEKFVKDHAGVGILSIYLAIAKKTFNEQHIAEALLWIGDMEHDSTKNARRLLLENALDSESVFIRDAAVSGLSYLSDPRSIPRLSKAQEEESAQGICANIKTVLKYLHQPAS